LFGIVDFIPEEEDSEKSAPSLEGRVIPSHAISRLFLPIVQVLQIAHENGIFHRDTKGANILMPKDAEGNPYLVLVDWGIAKTTAVDKKLTATGMMVGTPYHLAPITYEDPVKTEIFQFGIVLYEAATGKNPFKEMANYNAYLTRPFVIDTGIIGTPHLAALVQKALHPNPQENYPSMAALGIDLGGLGKDKTALSGKRPGRSLPPPPPKRGSAGPKPGAPWVQRTSLPPPSLPPLGGPEASERTGIRLNLSDITSVKRYISSAHHSVVFGARELSETELKSIAENIGHMLGNPVILGQLSPEQTRSCNIIIATVASRLTG
jgi:serine/threonine protein kinase